MNFKHWYDEIADMPFQDNNGNWVDLETGIPFKPFKKVRRGLKPDTRSDKPIKLNDADKAAFTAIIKALKTGEIEATLAALTATRMPVLVAICHKLTKRNDTFANKNEAVQAIKNALTA